MKRIALMVFKKLYILPFWFAKICSMAKDPDEHRYTLKEKYQYLRKVIIEVNKAGRVQIVSSGKENIPGQDGFVMYPNHQGLFDMLAIIESLDRPYAVVFKKEVSGTILLQQIIEAFHYIPIDRSDLKQSAGVIIEVTKRVKKGENFLIFAEGTRSKNGNEILPFKPGAFKAATRAKAPIVPVALLNSFYPFDSHSIDPVSVEVHFLKPMYYDEYAEMTTTEIATEVENRIREAIKKQDR